MQFDKLPEVGVPKTGVVRVGEVANTLLPVPVFVTLTTFLLASSAKAVDAVKLEKVVVLEAESVVNAPVLGVVAPTVPFMFIEAVPVRLVTVPDDGVPRAPPLTTNAPAVPVLTPKAVTTPVPVVTVEGAAPAPPPTTRALAANAADEAQVFDAEKYGTPPDVPAIVKAGVVVAVATETMPPVQLTEVTVPLVAGAWLSQFVPLLVRTFPVVPGATNVTLEVPAPMMTLLAVRVVSPVPP